MIDGYFCYRPAYNPIFSPIMGSYQVTRQGGTEPYRPQPNVSAHNALQQLDIVGDQARPQLPMVNQWTDRTPESVVVGGLIDVYDTNR